MTKRLLAKVNSILTAPLFPIIEPKPVAMVLFEHLEIKGISLMLAKMTRCVAYKETEPTIA